MLESLLLAVSNSFVSRELGRSGSRSRMIFRISSRPERISSLASNGVAPVSSS